MCAVNTIKLWGNGNHINVATGYSTKNMNLYISFNSILGSHVIVWIAVSFEMLAIKDVGNSWWIYAMLCYAMLRYATLLYSTLLYSMLLYSTLLYSTLLYATLLYSMLLYSTLCYATLLYSILTMDSWKCWPIDEFMAELVIGRQDLLEELGEIEYALFPSLLSPPLPPPMPFLSYLRWNVQLRSTHFFVFIGYI